MSIPHSLLVQVITDVLSWGCVVLAVVPAETRVYLCDVLHMDSRSGSIEVSLDVFFFPVPFLWPEATLRTLSNSFYAAKDWYKKTNRIKSRYFRLYISTAFRTSSKRFHVCNLLLFMYLWMLILFYHRVTGSFLCCRFLSVSVLKQ